MIEVIASMLSQKGEILGQMFSELERRDYLLQDDDKEIFSFLKEHFDRSGETPSSRLLADRFPERADSYEVSDAYSLQDAKLMLLDELDELERSFVQGKMAKINARIIEEGMSDEIFEEIREVRSKHSKTTPPPPVHYRISQEFERLYEDRESKPSGCMLGIPKLDNELGGMSPGTVNTIMGWVGSRKSTFALNVAYHNVLDLNFNAVFMSFELPREDLWLSLASRHSLHPKFDKPPVPQSALRDLKMTPEQREHIVKTVVPDLDSMDKKLLILGAADFKSTSIEDIYEKMVEVDQRMGGVDLWIWDHIQMFKFVKADNARTDEKHTMNIYFNQIMKWAINFRGKKTVQLVCAQVNRAGWSKAVREEGRYELTALAEVNEAERASTRVLSVFSSDELDAARSCKIQVLKSRYTSGVRDPVSVDTKGEYYMVGDVQKGITKSNGDLAYGFANGLSADSYDNASLDIMAGIR